VEIPVINQSGKAVSPALAVSDANFAAPFNETLVHQVVLAYQAGGRQGTRGQKNRAAVRGGGSKPWRQKGTGRARAGTTRSPLWRGGGKVFPASTRDFSQKVNRKMHRAAFRSILSELVRQERLIVVDGLSMAEPKTREMVGILGQLKAPRALVILEAPDRNLELAARNLPFVHVIDVAAADPVSMVGFEKVVMTAGAVRKYEEWLS